MLTAWGYEVDSLPDLITPEQFSDATDGRYDGDGRIPGAIAAASAAIRSFCGWHVAPALDCSITLDGEAGDIWLPTCALNSVASATVNGAEVEVTGHNRRGRVRLAGCGYWRGGLGNVTVDYNAGFDSDIAPDLVSIVAKRVVAEVALTTYGVASESAGGVSISYSGTALSDSGGTYLPDDVRQALMPYKLVRAHAA